MLRVSAGHYRDSFCRVTYDVKKVTIPWDRHAAAWSFTIINTGFENGSWRTKTEAAQKARVHIYGMKLDNALK
jgi:hypothetical protein